MRRHLKHKIILVLLLAASIPAVLSGVDILSAALGGLVLWAVLRPGEVFRTGADLYDDLARAVSDVINKK